MRIIFDHQAFSLQSHGGITRVFSEILRYLNQEPSVSAAVLLGYSNTRVDFRELVSPAGLVFHPGRAPFRDGLLNYALNEALTGLYAPCLGKFDIYHSTLYRFMPFVRAKRLVATHHDCVQELFPDLFPDRKRIMYAKRAMFRKADLILCVSESSRRDLLGFYDINPEKTVVVHNGVTPMRSTPQGLRQLQSIVNSEFLLYVGARHSYKNFDNLLRAYKQSGVYRELVLLVVGGGHPTDCEKREIADLQIEDSVRFVPHAPSSLLAAAYARASLLVYPSLYEGFGMPPLEAASAGCPALVARNPAAEEICGDAAYYCDPLDNNDFAEQLKFALADKEGREKRVLRGQELLSEFTWARCARRTLMAYQQALL